MGLIRVQNLVKQFGGRVVFDDLSLELNSGEHIGLVGPNGAGKTTLFRILAGETAPDIGSVTLSRGMLLGYLPQEPQIGLERTLHDEVLSVFAEVLALEQKLEALAAEMSVAGADVDGLMAEYDRARARFDAAGGYSYEARLAEILGGLGFSQADWKLPMQALSGGQKCRAALAKLLLDEAEFLLLDEPTNHLDIDAVRWLEKFLAGHKGGAVIISHDRYLLDRACDRIIELDGGQARSYPGNYSSYVRVRETQRLTQERQFEKDRAFIEKERDFIARHMGSQRTAEARGRLTRLERRLDAGEFTLARPAERDVLKLGFGAAEGLKPGQDVLELLELSKGYAGRPLFADVSLRLTMGMRLGITGPNGVGKSTLLKVLLGQLPADAGQVRWAAHVRPGYFAQDVRELDPQRTVVQELLAVRPELRELGARNLAARFLFKADDVFKLVGQLSGGEQSRVRLMKLMLGDPNVLIFDEPTNHLDIASREVLEAALADFPGTIISVSHDRYFLDRICNRLLVMRPGEHRLFQGNYTQYIEAFEQEREAAERARAAPEKPASSSEPAAAAAAARPRRANPQARKSRFGQMAAEELEAFIVAKEREIAAAQERFGEPALYQDPGAAQKLTAEIEALKADLAQAEEEWLGRG